MSSVKKFRVLELYSGIGGMHCALKESGISYEVVAAIDINTTANQIYRHNFQGTYLMDTGIEKLTVLQMDRMKIDMILMSPPCQPFTRVGKKLDKEDVRTKSLLHLLDILPQLSHCPSYILVENVKGFEESQTRDLLVNALQKCQFFIQEYMLTPLQFGIPNSRLRYYMIAKRETGAQAVHKPTTEEISHAVPDDSLPFLRYKKLCESESKCYHKNNERLCLDFDNPSKDDDDVYLPEGLSGRSRQSTSDESQTEEDGWMILNNKAENNSTNNEYQPKHPSSPVSCDQNPKRIKTELKGDGADLKHSEDEDPQTFCESCDNDRKQLAESQLLRQTDENDGLSGTCLQLYHFLEKESPKYFQKFKVPDKDLTRFIVMDVVFPCLRKTICFTKRYGHYMEGAGSIIQMSTDVECLKRAVELKLEAIEKKNSKQWGEEEISIIRNLQLRYFTPREIANLLCFPKSYSFPENLSTIQLYRVLGNSLNIHVVSVLIRLLVEK